MPMKSDFNGKLVFGLAFTAWIFAVIGNASKALFVADCLGYTNNIGVWKYSINGVEGDSKCEDISTMFGGKAPDCADAVGSKCKAQKAFGVIGILATTAATIGGVLLSEGQMALPKMAITAGHGVAAFSYLIVFAVAASLLSNDPSTGSDCGLKTIPYCSSTSGGAAFAGFVIACFASVACCVLSGKLQGPGAVESKVVPVSN